MKWVWMALLALALAIGYGAWRDADRKAQAKLAKAAPAVGTTATSGAATMPPPATAGIPVPGEPPEGVLVKFMQEEYDEINRAGGLPVTVSASGQSMVLKPKMYSARKIDCRPVPREPEGSYECSLDMMVTLREGDKKPGQHAERQYLHWDGQRGEWVRGLASRKRSGQPSAKALPG